MPHCALHRQLPSSTVLVLTQMCFTCSSIICHVSLAIVHVFDQSISPFNSLPHINCSQTSQIDVATCHHLTQSINSGPFAKDVTSLHEENEYNLDTATVKNCFNWTPLHVAASRGQQELFRELLSRNPELADALDLQQRSLLHLASANGHIEIVKALTEVRPEMCLARDRDSANPLHVAAMRGKVEVLDELFQANPEAARAYRMDKGERETILHLCVKYNQLQFLSMLLDKYFKGEEFVNATDAAGNTILHLAVADRRYEIIMHVLKHTEIYVNATNASEQTAMDILLLGQEKGTKPEGVDEDILALLQNYHAKRGQNDILNRTQNVEGKNGIMVAAVLMATLFFQAGVAPPGGVWPDNNDGHISGEAVMAFNYPTMYRLFHFSNMSGFIASLGTVIFIMLDLLFKKERFMQMTAFAMGGTISTIVYWISLTVVSKDERTTNPNPKSTIVHLLIPLFVLLAAFLLWRRIARIVGEKKRRNRASFNRLSHANNQASVNEANV